jgi:WD40 repeat protein
VWVIGWQQYLVCHVTIFLEIYTNIEIWTFQGHSEETWGLCVHPSKPLFVTCGYDKMLCLWNSEDKSLVWAKQLEVCNKLNKFVCMDSMVISIAFSPTICIWPWTCHLACGFKPWQSTVGNAVAGERRLIGVAIFPKGGQTKKDCFLAMFPEGWQSR